MSQKSKIESLLNGIKLEVENTESFEKDTNAVMGMFDKIKEADVESIDSNLHKKEIALKDLRDDESYEWNFRPEMRGNYFKVPNVSKKKQ